MAVVPFLAAAVAGTSQIMKARSEADALGTNANIMRTESALALGQGAQAEAQSRRSSREAIGRQAAAFGAAGVGYGGSSEKAMSQSLVNQEMDALNTRYKGTLTAYGYQTQAQIDAEAAGQAKTAGYINAGTSALKAYAGSYTGGG